MKEVDAKFSEAFARYFVGCQQVYQEYCDVQHFTVRDKFKFTEGNRYVKVICGTGVHSFVDRTNGDVLKPESWKKPAKHARGNIYDEHNGLGSMTGFGPAYLR